MSQAPKDGYTLLMGTVANTINTTLAPQTRFDFARDFAPVAALVVLPNVLVVHPDTGVKNLSELIALAKSKPDCSPSRPPVSAPRRICPANCSTRWPT